MTDAQVELRQLKEEQARRLEEKICRANPLYWLEHKLKEAPTDYHWSLLPEYEDHQWDGDVDPLFNAWQSVANGHWVGIEAATGTSKTFFLSRLVLWFLDTHEDALVVTSAPKQDQLKLHLWSELTKVFHKFKKIRTKAEMLSLRLIVDAKGEVVETDEESADFSKSWQAIGFVAGAGAEEQSATKAQGFHRKNMLIICEETPGMPSAVMTAFQNTCTGENNIILAVGNPDSELDELHTFCQMENVMHYRISAYDYPNVVLNNEKHPGAVTRASIERRKLKYGEASSMYMSRVRGISPAQSEDSLIKLEWIDACIGKELINAKYSWNAVGVDVANSVGGDKAALCWGIGATLKELQEFQCPNASHLAYNLMLDDHQLREKKYGKYPTSKLKDYDIHANCIGVDAVGVGVSTVNEFLNNGMKVTSLQGGEWKEIIPLDTTGQPMWRFISLRAQMYWELREDFRAGAISIDLKDADLIRRMKKELTTIKFDQRGGTIAVEKKEDIKKRLGGKSPNMADAIAYWNWSRKCQRNQRIALPFSAGA